jgi:hypothetical protein
MMHVGSRALVNSGVSSVAVLVIGLVATVVLTALSIWHAAGAGPPAPPATPRLYCFDTQLQWYWTQRAEDGWWVTTLCDEPFSYLGDEPYTEAEYETLTYRYINDMDVFHLPSYQVRRLPRWGRAVQHRSSSLVSAVCVGMPLPFLYGWGPTWLEPERKR